MTWFTVCFGQKLSFPADQTVDINKESTSKLNAEISSLPNAKLYSYKELQIATGNFNRANKIGEGGFGSVYKGRLDDGTLAAIKVLSAQSEQGVREFLNEIITITGIEHENLVKLYGCCTELEQRILVYGYLENNSLAQTLLRGQSSNLLFTWEIRSRICIGVAQGLAFLHNEFHPHIVHRDIKASNILLDKDFTPKISDFGLAKLFPSTMTHVTTRVAGTFGYLAPEYAIQGKLTRKADIYSFGVLLLEIISGRCNTNKRLPAEEQKLLEMAWKLHERDMVVELVDESLAGNFDSDEAIRFLRIALLCTQDMPKSRPAMSDVAKMLRGEMDANEMELSKPGLLKELMTLSGSTSETQDESTLLSRSADISYATMTFSSIYDRSV